MDHPPKPSTPAAGVDHRLHFLDYWRIVRIRKTVILAVFLLVVLTTTAVTFLLPESYMSTVRIAIEKDASVINPIGFAQNTAAFDPYFIQTEFEKIRSKSVLYRVITNAELNLNQRFGDRYNDGQPLKTSQSFLILSGMIDVRQTRNTSLIEIRVYSESKESPAQEAADIANLIAEVYKQTRLELKQAQSLTGINTLTNQLAKQQVEVQALQKELDKLKGDLNISESVAEGTVVATTIEPQTVLRLEGERITVEAQYTGLSELLSKLKELQNQGGSELQAAILTAYPDQELGKLLQDLWLTEASLAKASAVYGLSHPEVRQLASMQQVIAKNVNDRIDGIMTGLKARVDAKLAELDSLARAVQAAKEHEQDMTKTYRPYFIKKRDLENVQKIRDAILLRVLQEQVDLAIPKESIVEITDAAEPSLRPVRPNIPLNIALGIIVGLVVGVGLAFFIEYLDTSVKTIDDVERSLGAAVLGVIPQNVGSLLDEGPESPHAEAYRVLRTNILFSRKRENATTLTVVSGGAGEGKSTTIFNLCSVFAQNNQRVLLVDSDLRRPSLHKLLRVSNTVGLTSFLLGQKKLEEVIQTTKQANLDFLPSGKLPSSSLGILNSPQMRDFIQEVRQRYDWVLFDSPPIMGVSDASILTSMVDLTLLVIQYRKYPQAMTVRAKQMVEKIGGNLLGVVLNNINISQDSYYYYYSGYYYDYYSKRDDSGTGKNGEKRSSRSSRKTKPEVSDAPGESAGSEIKQKY
jgi:capsular exopolysaccharide synthesis family protein